MRHHRGKCGISGGMRRRRPPRGPFVISRPRVVSAMIESCSSSLRRQLAVRSCVTQEPEVDRHEHQDDADVGRQPLPDVTSEEENVYRDHDSHHRNHVQRPGCRPSHGATLATRLGRAAPAIRSRVRSALPGGQVARARRVLSGRADPGGPFHLATRDTCCDSRRRHGGDRDAERARSVEAVAREQPPVRDRTSDVQGRRWASRGATQSSGRTRHQVGRSPAGRGWRRNWPVAVAPAARCPSMRRDGVG